MTPEPNRKSVLIVEDETNLADMYEVWLEDDYDVSTAYSGKAALEEIESDTDAFDVVLLDRRMPGIPGDEVAKEIEENGYDTQVIMITAISPSPEIATIPIDDYVTKPVKKEKMHNLIETAVSVMKYEEAVEDIFALIGRKYALMDELSADELESSEEFARLEDRIEEIHDSRSDAMEELVEELDQDTFSRIENGVTEHQIQKDDH